MTKVATVCLLIGVVLYFTGQQNAIGIALMVLGGLGLIDGSYPEYMFNGNNTTDSNSRGVLRNIPAGTYQIEFIGWERTGVAHYEIYAANGAFIDDAETVDWKLIGDVGGLELVQGASVAPLLRGITLNNGDVVIRFTSAGEPSTHQLFESSDLVTWKASTGVVFVKGGADGMHTARVARGIGNARYYRLSLP